MTSFLDTVAADLYKRYGERISELCLVFPNKRAQLFFAQSLSHVIDKPLWQPAYKSIEELVIDSSQLQIADTFTLLVELYEIYCSKRKTTEPFDRFYYWGETLLHDFDQVDKYLVNAPALFSNIYEFKDLEGDFSFLTPEQIEYIQKFWSHFSEENESRLQQDFISIWEALLPIYNRFRANLTVKNKAYEGMLYRLMAEKIKEGDTDNLLYGKYVFIGFNALNECEKVLFRFLQKQQQADFYWDYDTYYLDNEQQEAGLFLRENIKHFPPPDFDADFSPFSEKKEMQVIASPSNLAQVKVVPRLLETMAAAPDQRTAIVLADEQLLIPLLHALPAAAQEINITMGYPLRQTAVYSLIEIFLQLFNNGKLAEKQVKYYYQDIFALLSHPYINYLTNNDKNSMKNKLVIFNNIYVSNLFFADNQFIYDLLLPIDNFRDLTNRLLFLANCLSENKWLNNSDPLLRDNLQYIVDQLNKFTKALEKSTFDISISLFTKLLKNIFRQATIPFTGEPLAGIQILGMLETRSLDFDNLIILSANESILPRSNKHISFIPYNLRNGFGLPMPEHQEAVWAYYFYRLLQRAQHVKFVYNTKTDGITTGELSRYVLQLKLESGHKVKEETLSFDIEIPENKAIIIEKTPSILQKLENYCGEAATKKLSPSALNSYLTCPLRFYFKYITGLNEPDEILEKVDSRLFGNLLHKSMEIIYKPWIGEEIDESVFVRLLADREFMEQIVQQSIAEVFYRQAALPPDFRKNGDLLMVHDILCQYVRQLLLVDKKQAPFVIEGIEYPVSHYFSFTTKGETKQLFFGGIIDRLHRKDKVWYVVDYKTGVIDNEFHTIEGLFESESNKQHPAILQTLLYSLAVQAEKKETVAPLLYFLRDSHSEAADFSIFDKMTKEKITDVAEYAEVLEESLSAKLAELFDPDIPFIQTTDENACKYCVYKTICRK